MERQNDEKIEEKQLEQAVVNLQNAELFQDSVTHPITTGLKSCAYGLVQCVPVLGSVLTDTMERGLDYHQSKMRMALIDTILNYEGVIKERQLDGVSFVVEFAKTQEVLNRLSNDKKVAFICNLFGNYFFEENHYNDVDLYEEYLEHLASLSYREIELLISLHHFEKIGSHEHIENKLQRRQKSFGKLKSEAKCRWGITATQLEGIMTSISKSGFCREVTGTYLNYEGGVFYTTAYFEHFLSYIRKRYNKENDF